MRLMAHKVGNSTTHGPQCVAQRLISLSLGPSFLTSRAARRDPSASRLTGSSAQRRKPCRDPAALLAPLDRAAETFVLSTGTASPPAGPRWRCACRRRSPSAGSRCRRCARRNAAVARRRRRRRAGSPWVRSRRDTACSRHRTGRGSWKPRSRHAGPSRRESHRRPEKPSSSSDGQGVVGEIATSTTPSPR